MLKRIIITDDAISIDGQILNPPIKYKSIEDILGLPSRTFRKVNFIYTYDDIGIYFHSEDENHIEQINVDFKTGFYEFSPSNNYKGDLYINSKKIVCLDDFIEIGDDNLDRNEEEAEGIIGMELENVEIVVDFDLDTRDIIKVSFYYL